VCPTRPRVPDPPRARRGPVPGTLNRVSGTLNRVSGTPNRPGSRRQVVPEEHLKKTFRDFDADGDRGARPAPPRLF